MLIALIAAGCMVVEDILAVIMVQAEAANKGWLAGWMDTLAWYFGIETTSISVGALHSHSTIAKVYVLAFVGAANLLGTKSGQMIGKRLVKSVQRETVDSLHAKLTVALARIAALEAGR